MNRRARLLYLSEDGDIATRDEMEMQPLARQPSGKDEQKATVRRIDSLEDDSNPRQNEPQEPTIVKAQTADPAAKPAKSAADPKPTANEGQPTANDAKREESELDIARLTKAVAPVTIALLAVIIVLNLRSEPRQPSKTSYAELMVGSDKGEGISVKDTVIVVMVFTAMIVIATTLMVVSYKLKLYCFLRSYFKMASFSILALLVTLVLSSVLVANNIPIDWITTVFMVLNSSVVMVLSMFWKGPQLLQNATHIIMSVSVANVLNDFLPQAACFGILSVLIVWAVGGAGSVKNLDGGREKENFTMLDMIAVLPSWGPLRILIKTTQERGEIDFLRPLIYRATIIWDERALRRASRLKAGSEAKNTDDRVAEDEEEEEDHGVQLGLGDFIFYSMYVAMAVQVGDPFGVVVAFLAVITGMLGTMIILGILQKPLPALPLSISIGLILYVVYIFVGAPFLQFVMKNGIVI